MAQAENSIPREEYTRPIYIKTRKATLAVNFAPEQRDGEWRSTLYSKVMNFCSENEEYPFWDFVIKTQAKKPPVRIKIDDQSFFMMNRVLDNVTGNSWASIADVYRYQECKNQLDKKYQIRNCDLVRIPPEYLYELARIEKEQETLSGIEDCVEPMVVCKFVNEGWHKVSPGHDTTGATMLVYYQPRTKSGEPVKRPWTIEILQYRLAYADGVLVHKNEVSLSIQLKMEDMRTLLDQMICDYTLWAGEERTVALYKKNPENYRRMREKTLCILKS